MASASKFNDCVFINCPFDKEYWPLFESIVFTIVDCGFTPRCALEEPDSGDARVRRVQRIIQSSRYAIHDISRVQLTPKYPRFNMAFEVGLDLGCRRFGNGPAKRKRCLIMDKARYRYPKFFSDIAGQDVKAHKDSPDKVVTIVRDWLRGVSKRTRITGPQEIRRHFKRFSTALPTLCKESGLNRKDLLFADYVTLVEGWLVSGDIEKKSRARLA